MSGGCCLFSGLEWNFFRPFTETSWVFATHSGPCLWGRDVRMSHSLWCGKKPYWFCTFVYIMTVFLERMQRRKEELALISHLVFGCMEMVQSPWAIPGISLMGACIQRAAVVGSQTGNRLQNSSCATMYLCQDEEFLSPCFSLV